MNFKKKSLILIILFIISIQILLYLNNSQKTSFRYFIWNIQDISIGRLITISFMSGIVVSSILNKTLKNNTRTNSNKTNNEQWINSEESNYDTNKEDKNNSFEMPPERDMRDTQPTISVNYRVIKNNQEDEAISNRKQTTNNARYEDDWNNNFNEW